MNNPSKRLLIGPLQHWLESLPHSMPLLATTDTIVIEGKSLDHWMDQSHLSADSLESAMLWLRVGRIDPTHEIVQEGKTAFASYLHGVVHRLEGDYWNSKYWFRQVRDHRLLQSLSISISQRVESEGLTSLADNMKIIKTNTFDPSELVNAVERHFQNSNHDAAEATSLELISWIEWQSIWENF